VTPQVIVTLAPDGSLIAELPASNGSRRQVPLKGGLTVDGESYVETTLLRILQNQLRQQVEIGLDGAPTGQQVRHWERHQIWSDPSCRFCISEGRFESGALGSLKARAKRDQLLVKRDGVEVRRLSKRGRVVATTESCEELGL
jgi:hypothetical protein